MISEKELRIGNFFEDYNGKIEAWTLYDFNLLQHADVDELVKPVPLTSEILKRAGFEYRDFLNDYYIKVGLNSILTVTNSELKICASNQQPCVFNGIRYLHQLQNLYECLCGEELKVL